MKIKHNILISLVVTGIVLLTGCSKVAFDEGLNIQQKEQDLEAGPILNFPSIHGEVAAVAFEDNFPKPGDADYNDFLTNFRVTEKINKDNQVTNIIIDFYPRAVGATYDHTFLLVLDGIKDQPSNISLETPPLFNGDAQVQLTYYNSSGLILAEQDNLSVSKDLVVFGNTHSIFNAFPSHVLNTYIEYPYFPAAHSARVEIELANPELNPLGLRSEVDTSKLRMVLHVKNTQKDIDIIDVDSANFDSNGYPFGFIIPSNWQWPREGVDINSAYPHFSKYQAYLLEKAAWPDTVVTPEAYNWFISMAHLAEVYPVTPLPPLLPLD